VLHSGYLEIPKTHFPFQFWNVVKLWNFATVPENVVSVSESRLYLRKRFVFLDLGGRYFALTACCAYMTYVNLLLSLTLCAYVMPS